VSDGLEPIPLGLSWSRPGHWMLSDESVVRFYEEKSTWLRFLELGKHLLALNYVLP